jgi:hypothetical protein
MTIATRAILWPSRQSGRIRFDAKPGVSGCVLPLQFHSRMENGQLRTAAHASEETRDVLRAHIDRRPTSMKRGHLLVKCGFLLTVPSVMPHSYDAEEYRHGRDENHEVPRRETAGSESAGHGRVPTRVHCSASRL